MVLDTPPLTCTHQPHHHHPHHHHHHHLPSPSTQQHRVNQPGSIIGIIPPTTLYYYDYYSITLPSFVSLPSPSGQILVTVAVAFAALLPVIAFLPFTYHRHCRSHRRCRIHHQLSLLLSSLSQASFALYYKSLYAAVIVVVVNFIALIPYHYACTPPVSFLFLLLSYYLLFNILT
jgi:hypothetical protein